MDYDSDFGPIYYPALLQIGLTYRCNLECPHCYALYHRTKTEFTTEEVKRLIDDACQLGSCKVVYSHGENLIRSDFHQLAEYISSRDMFQTLMTNGFYLQTNERVDRLEATGINKVMVSIDSSVPEEHNVNRGNKHAYVMAIKAIENLRKWTKMKVGISMAIDTRNYMRIREVAALGESLGVHFISLMQVRPNQPHTFANYDWTNYEDVCRDIYELILEYRGRVDIYSHDPFMNTLMDERIGDEFAREDYLAHNVCNVGKYMVSICPDGEVTGCNFIERSVGNVRTEPLSVIWDRLMTDYNDDNWQEGPCSGCGQHASCKTGCKAFHLPWQSHFDKRCELQRFGDASTATHTPRPTGRSSSSRFLPVISN